MDTSRVTYSDLEDDALRQQLRRDIVATERSAWLKVFFLQNMSHELRNPLTAICGFSSLIAEMRAADSDEETRHMAARIADSSNALLHEISNLLATTRQECLQRQQAATDGDADDGASVAELFARLNAARQLENSRTQLTDDLSRHVHSHIDAIVDFAHKLAADPAADGATPADDISDFVALIEENSRMLLTLVDDIRDWSQMQSGVYRTRWSVVNLRHVCKVCLESVRMKLQPGVELRLDFRLPADTMLRTDSVRLQQILRNLLVNATKHTAAGTITLECRHADEGTAVAFAVADTGEGIAPENAELIFHRFEQLGSFRKGSGLGLHICRLVAGRLGGEVHLDTSYSGGARFVFTHPILSDNDTRQ